MIARRIRYFLAGILGHRDKYPHSGAIDAQLMDAFWAGYAFAWKFPRFVRRMLAKRTSR